MQGRWSTMHWIRYPGAVHHGAMERDVGRREFSIEMCLGKGGFGEVYRAQMRSAGGLESEVAVKVLRGDLDPASQAVQRLRDEGRMLARLNHPAILKVHDLVLLEGRIALVTEYIEGQDLTECVRGDGAMPMRPLLEVVAAVAGALDAAWSTPGPDGKPLQLVHRDIKPSNIRISKHGQIKVLDFGIARSDSMQREAKTQTDLMVGSPHYLAPERFVTPAGGPESDVFALGCALYEGLTGGRRLYQDDTVLMMSAQALSPERFAESMAERMVHLAADLDPEVRQILDATLRHDPSTRPTARALQTALEELAEEFQGPSVKKWARKRSWPAVGQDNGPLEGRTISEGTLAVPTQTIRTPLDANTSETELMATAEVAGPRTGVAIGVAVLAALVAAGALIGVGLGGVAIFQLSGNGAAEVADIDEPNAEAEPESDAAADAAPAEAEPEAEPEAGNESAPGSGGAPAPAPQVDPEAPSPQPVAQPEPVVAQPEPLAAQPEPVEPPVASASAGTATGTVTASGGVDVELRQGDDVLAPGEVPAGTYEVWARFGDQMRKQSKPVTVVSGGVHTIACSARMFRCDVR